MDTLNAWLIRILIVSASLLPLFIQTDPFTHPLALAVFAADVIGVLPARTCLARLQHKVDKSGALRGLNRRAANSQSLQALVLAAGMAFGISAALVHGFLAYEYGF